MVSSGFSPAVADLARNVPALFRLHSGVKALKFRGLAFFEKKFAVPGRASG
jgi:hypothetical protein